MKYPHCSDRRHGNNGDRDDAPAQPPRNAPPSPLAHAGIVSMPRIAQAERADTGPNTTLSHTCASMVP